MDSAPSKKNLANVIARLQPRDQLMLEPVHLEVVLKKDATIWQDGIVCVNGLDEAKNAPGITLTGYLSRYDLENNSIDIYWGADRALKMKHEILGQTRMFEPGVYEVYDLTNGRTKIWPPEAPAKL